MRFALFCSAFRFKNRDRLGKRKFIIRKVRIIIYANNFKSIVYNGIAGNVVQGNLLINFLLDSQSLVSVRIYRTFCSAHQPPKQHMLSHFWPPNSSTKQTDETYVSKK